MVDYYTELNIDGSLGIDAINRELSRLENTWKRRELNSPEKATKVLALIIDAREVFKSVQTKSKYDRELAENKKPSKPSDPEKQRMDDIQKWKNDAEVYYESGQYDLAKIAVEKAISLLNVNGDDDALFSLAADICKDNGDLDMALAYINRAIVAAPEVPSYYLSKGLIYDQQALAAMQCGGYGNPANLHSEARKMFRIADVKGEQNGDLANRARACGALACSYYFQEPMDKKAGEDFAGLAAEFGGDPWGNADKVLAAVKRTREDAERKEREAQEKRRAEERRIREQKEAEKRAEQEQEEAVLRKKAERRRAIAKAFIVISVIVSVPILSLRHNLVSIGTRVVYNYDGNSGTLTVSGKGEIRDYPDTLFLGRGLNYPPWDQDRISNLRALCKLIAPINFTRDDVKTLTISDGITHIGDDAFSFPNITEVTIPPSVESIGAEAFDFCSNLEAVYLSKTVQIIGRNAFSGCDNAVIYYEGTISDWTEIKLQGNQRGLNLRGCTEIRCSDGTLSGIKSNTYIYQGWKLLIKYNGIMEQWNDYYNNNQPDFDTRYGYITVICEDGEIQYEP